MVLVLVTTSEELVLVRVGGSESEEVGVKDVSYVNVSSGNQHQHHHPPLLQQHQCLGHIGWSKMDSKVDSGVVECTYMSSYRGSS